MRDRNVGPVNCRRAQACICAVESLQPRFRSRGAYARRSHEECAALAQAGDTAAAEYLVERFRRVAVFKSRHYFAPGCDRDDMIQWGMIGLSEAIYGFRPGEQANFRTFADLCITREMLTVLQLANTLGKRALNEARSLDSSWTEGQGTVRERRTAGRGSEGRMEHQVPADERTPEVAVVNHLAAQDELHRLARACSAYEYQVAQFWAAGKSYIHIAVALGVKEKSVDNALCRVRKHLHKLQAEVTE